MLASLYRSKVCSPTVVSCQLCSSIRWFASKPSPRSKPALPEVDDAAEEPRPTELPSAISRPRSRKSTPAAALVKKQRIIVTDPCYATSDAEFAHMRANRNLFVSLLIPVELRSKLLKSVVRYGMRTYIGSTGGDKSYAYVGSHASDSSMTCVIDPSRIPRQKWSVDWEDFVKHKADAIDRHEVQIHPVYEVWSDVGTETCEVWRYPARGPIKGLLLKPPQEAEKLPEGPLYFGSDKESTHTRDTTTAVVEDLAPKA